MTQRDDVYWNEKTKRWIKEGGKIDLAKQNQRLSAENDQLRSTLVALLQLENISEAGRELARRGMEGRHWGFV